ncbi:MGDG synthase family glycosyltransferase [Alicyclobacillus sp. ALC3]|uniref:MGDG synthase family glycosyltransferase n=1 Tax=Alicyclobacillus sp. ALC3 TaxID=2796143 RepID=UPI00237A02C4|nr:glycosyltransferase [Alicyclobacillus sp. ALC3]WDL96836.1 glycosyltransferase [Alicyclobacillus sp. ALC3]
MVKVLLVTASYGEGHNQAAHAVAEALEAEGATPRIVDYTDLLHPAVRSLTKFTLLQGVQRVPALYGVFYRSMSRMDPSSSIQRQMHHLGMQQLKKFLASWQPDVVASTFPSPAGVVSELRRTGRTRLPNAAIITDYTFNGQWIAENIDAYYVPVESATRDFVEHGVPTERLHTYGIPIRSRFNESQVRSLLRSRMLLRQEQGLRPDKPLILLMGGGAGLLGDPVNWQRLVQRLDAQFVIICGNNVRLRKLFAPLVCDRVRVLGYVQNVEDWMAMADLIVTKAGGITVTESLAMELPMLIYRPIPGQEVENARFALSTGAAELATNLAQAEAFLERAVADPSRLERMRAAARGFSSVRGSASRIAVSLLDLAARAKDWPVPSAVETSSTKRRSAAAYSSAARGRRSGG